MTLYGVADRNIECWLAADRAYLARQLSVPPKSLAVADPKGVFEHALGITSFDRKEEEIAAIVCEAPLRNWLKRSSSFQAFYEDAWSLSKKEGNPIPNEWERE